MHRLEKNTIKEKQEASKLYSTYLSLPYPLHSLPHHFLPNISRCRHALPRLPYEVLFRHSKAKFYNHDRLDMI